MSALSRAAVGRFILKAVPPLVATLVYSQALRMVLEVDVKVLDRLMKRWYNYARFRVYLIDREAHGYCCVFYNAGGISQADPYWQCH